MSRPSPRPPRRGAPRPSGLPWGGRPRQNREMPFLRTAAPVVVALLLSLLVLKQAVWSSAAVAQPRELMYGEAVLYDHAARLLRGQALYPA